MTFVYMGVYYVQPQACTKRRKEHMVKARTNFTLDPEILEAARRRSDETGVVVSFVVERALAHWVATGEIAPAVPQATTAPKRARRKGGAKPETS